MILNAQQNDRARPPSEDRGGLLTVPEVAARLGVKVRQVRLAIREKRLLAARIGRVTLIKPEAIDAWIDREAAR